MKLDHCVFKMSVRIILDKGPEVYTNLDLVTGRVLLRLQREETLAAIVVKLECESRTRLAQPYDDRRNTYDTELEVHKVGDGTVAESFLIL